jgi:hypothetical protein
LGSELIGLLPPAVGFWVFGLGILGAFALVLWVVGLVDILRRDDLDTRQRTAWILIVVLLPIIGTVIYFVRRPTSEREFEQAVRAQTHRRP